MKPSASFKWAGILVGCLWLSSLARSSDNGTTSAGILKLGAGARALGLGEAASASARPEEALFWNPSRLVEAERPTFMLTYNPILDKTKVNQASAVFRQKSFAFGVGYIGISQDPIDSYDEVGNKTGAYDASDHMGSLGMAFGSPAFACGVGGKFLRSEIGRVRASAVAADAGVTFQNPWARMARHAFVVKNVGGKMTFLSEGDPLPLQFTWGNAVSFGKALVWNVDISRVRDAGLIFATGAEWAMVLKENNGVFLRGGYNTKRNQIDKLSGASVGLGFSFKALSLDYAWIPYGALGDTHAVTLVFRLPKWEPRPKMPQEKKAARQTINNIDNPDARPLRTVVITLDSGKKVQGAVLRETSNKFIVKSGGRIFNVFKDEIIRTEEVPPERLHIQPTE